MPRLPLSIESKLPQDVQAQYTIWTGSGSALPDTYRALFAHPQAAAQIIGLGEILNSELEPSVTLTVALTVAHERDCSVLWDSIEPFAQSAGVSNAAINGIASGKGPRGLLPKDGIWIQFTLEILRDEVRDSTWQAITHLVGDAGAVSVALTVCYYDMMVRLNSAFALESA